MKQSEAAQQHKPDRPYKRWDYFESKDHSIFFGRTLETRLLFSEILSSRLVLLYAKSGTGKTSLINAGVRPLLEDLKFRTFVIRAGDNPLEEIKSNTQSLAPEEYNDARHKPLKEYFKQMLEKRNESIVLFLDQFEEFFIHLKSDVQEEFISQVAELYHDSSTGVFVVFSLREDFFVEMDCFRSHIPPIFENNSNLRLRWFSDESAREAMEEPAKVFDCKLDPSLTTMLLKDLRRDGKGIEPIRLQLVCDALWDATGQGKTKLISVDDYLELGGVKAIEERAFKDALRKAEKADKKNILPSLLRMLITDVGTKNYVEIGTLTDKLKLRRTSVEKLLTALQETRLVRASKEESETFYELSHDYLVSQVQGWLRLTGGYPDIAREKARDLVLEWKKKREPISEGDFDFIDKQRALVELEPDEVEMLTQAAVRYNRNVSYWFTRLANDERAVLLIKELLGSDLSYEVENSCLLALGELRSAAATREIVAFALRDQSRPIIDLLAERADSATLYDLYELTKQADKSKRKSAIIVLAALRKKGIKLPASWSKASIYAVMSQLGDYGYWLEDEFGKASALLGSALEGFEESRSKGLTIRVLYRLRVWVAALLVGWRGALWGTLVGAATGAVGGFLFALFQDLWNIIAERSQTGRFKFELLFHGYWIPIAGGFKFGVFLGLVVGFCIVAGHAFLQAWRTMAMLEKTEEGEENSNANL